MSFLERALGEDDRTPELLRGTPFVGPPPGGGRRGRLGRSGPLVPLGSHRRRLAAAAGFLVTCWIVLVFAGTLAEAHAVNERAAAVQAEIDVLQAQLDAGRQEILLIQGDAFLGIQARAYGMGERGERPFALAADAPPPDQIVPLGGDPTPAEETAPLDAWLSLLFGPA